jgi:very-short-patch-repair endonuclease
MKQKSTTEKARALRKRSTEPETLLWRHLRAKGLGGLKFRRQEPIGNYIVDFVCFDRSLVVEIDGGQHLREEAEDAERTSWLQDQGFKVLRFWNNDVMKNIEGVLRVIRDNL